MPRINLLQEIKSVRNTITPHTPDPGHEGAKFPKIMLGLALIMVGAGALVAMGIVKVSYTPGQIPPVIIDFTGDENRPDVAIENDLSVTVADSGKAAPDEIEKYRSVTVADSGKAAPDETGFGAESNRNTDAGELPPVSRPIAQKAVSVMKKLKSGKTWHIRFGLCLMEESCEQIVTQLKSQGVEAYIVRDVANINTHRAIVGPWPTNAHAGKARSQLKRDGYDSSIFTSEGRFFLSTEPMASKAVAEMECSKIKVSGSECRASSKKESRRVYKVYEGAYKSRYNAVIRRMAYFKRGIDCIVESN